MIAYKRPRQKGLARLRYRQQTLYPEIRLESTPGSPPHQEAA